MVWEGNVDLSVAVAYWMDKGNPIKQEARKKMENSSLYSLYWLDPKIEHPRLQENGINLFHMSKQRKESMNDLRGFEQKRSVLNSEKAIKQTNNRLESIKNLQNYGIPVPEWDFGRDYEICLDTPVIAKSPHEGYSSGHSHQLFFDEEVSYDGDRLVQEFLEGPTLKGYRMPHLEDRPKVFAEIMGERRNKEGQEVLPSSEMTEIVEEVHGATDLEMFEVDMILSDEGYNVVDVNPFVSLRGIEDGSRLYLDSLVGQAYSETKEVSYKDSANTLVAE